MFSRSVAIATLIIACVTKPPVFAQESSASLVLETAREISILDESTEREINWISKADRGGFIVAGAQFINVGKLLIEGPGERTEACSGVLLTSDKFLTAAHCVCPVELFSARRDNETYAQTCRRRMGELQFRVVFPGVGVFDAHSQAEIMNDYLPLHLGSVAGVTRNADLAIISLVKGTDLYGVQRGHLTENGLRFSVGFGLHSFKIVPENSGYVEDNTYDDGPKQIAKYLDRKFYPSWQECGDGAASDTFCGEYNPIALQGRGADAAACNGDSGAPLFEFSGDGNSARLIGITSYIYPSPNGRNPCVAAAKAMTFFVDISQYSDWLSTHQTADDSNKQNARKCRSSVLVGPGSIAIKVPKSSISLVSYDLHNPAEPNQRPTTDVLENGELKCRHERTFGIHSCEASDDTTISITIGPSPFEGIKPLNQLVVCEKGEGK